MLSFFKEKNNKFKHKDNIKGTPGEGSLFALGKFTLLRYWKDRRISPVATGDQGSAFGNRKPLKRLDLNFFVLVCANPEPFLCSSFLLVATFAFWQRQICHLSEAKFAFFFKRKEQENSKHKAIISFSKPLFFRHLVSRKPSSWCDISRIRVLRPQAF